MQEQLPKHSTYMYILYIVKMQKDDSQAAAMFILFTKYK
jgi:hypothetical protein